MNSGRPIPDPARPRRRDRSLRVPAKEIAKTFAPEEASTAKTKRKRPVLLRVLNLFMFFLFVGVAGLLALHWGNQQFTVAGPLDAPKDISIKRGSGTSAIAKTLYSQGVIANELIFQAGVITRRAQSSLKAGEYRFEPGESMAQVLDKLVRGEVVTYKITVPEGLTSQQIVARLMAKEDLTGEILDIPPEGSLLPQTYNFSRGEDRGKVLERIRAAQKEIVEKHWAKRAADLPVKTPGEALILASIVEKETGVAAERRRVAAVFVNRLKKGIRLQSDPTIIYGLVGGQGKLGRPILRSEIDQKTPYNTYQINGLPPTPIANPGEAAIAAVLNPLKTDELYFVADGTGGHTFSKTLDEHNKKVRVWRKIARERREKAKKEAAAAAAAGGAEPSIEPAAAAAPTTKVTAEPVAPLAPSDGSQETVATFKAPAPDLKRSQTGEPVQAQAGYSAGGIPLPRPKPKREN
ncbi:MAG: endolytic transglycosylase MltG [Alphaproteobacteria bacterium]|nr:endolytic transglycosylase MltG [Alphaproteobacteria bacterium]